MNERCSDWENQTKETIPQWKRFIDGAFDDEDRSAIDWQWLRGLDLHSGLGLRVADKALSLLPYDYMMRTRLERALSVLSKAWMFDHDGIIPDYGLVRAMAHASRRLNDDIDCLERKMPEYAESSNDRGGNTHRHRSPRSSGTHGGGGDWQDRYLPGKDVGVVLGIDLETTGLNQYRDYIIDAGFEKMDMTIPVSADDDRSIYKDPGYRASGAYAQERHSYGMSALRTRMGNPTEFLTGISAADLHDLRPLDDDPDAQARLLKALTSAPYVAHNASFEHKHFMANVEGYAEAYKNGDITIIDTMYMSIKWGHHGSMKHDNNKLETYAKNWGGLNAVSSERHLGLEDAHIMLLAMNNHLHHLESVGTGPWDDVNGIDGVGGKHCHGTHVDNAPTI